ncbi:MAG: S8 family peptidase [Taibaiella sp.]|nr:S8 family peptidase [Taibaiella sp.]
MKSATSLLALCLFCFNVSAQQINPVQPKLSPLTKRYLNTIKSNPGTPAKGYIYNRAADGVTYLSALIKVSDATAAQTGLDGIKAKVGTRAGKIWTVKVPLDQVKVFSTLPGISYIQLDEPATPHMDMARKTTKADSAQGGYGLPMGYSGDGVVVGVIDFGFDYNHPTFYDTLGTNYRIKKIWEMNGSGTPPAGYTFGKEITDTNLIKTEGTDNAKQSHGTCTAGMAAGSGFGSPLAGTKYRGMAYAADMVLVGVRRDSIGGQWMEGSFSDFLDGVKYIFDYATSVGKPAVVNISWGSQSGSHDGTSLFNQACDALSGPGKIIVMSAGNEGEEKIHLSKTFTAADTVIKTYLTFNPTHYRRTWVDIWGEPGKTFCAKATLYSSGSAGGTTGYQCINDSVTDMYLIGANGIDTCFVEYISSAAEENGKPRMTINIYNKATDTIGISVKGTSGKIDMWDEYYYYGFPQRYQSAFDYLSDGAAASGNTVSTVSDMGSAQSVLLVGAYASKVDFTDMNGNNWSYSGYVGANRLVPFSSRGPMIDGRIKPDITAPGLTVATSMTSYDTSYTPTGSNSRNVISKYVHPTTGKEYYYTEFIGTSASGPAASGIVAMMLQANPTLTPDAVKTNIFASAITDVYTGTLTAAGNNSWGHGKINAYGALKRVIQTLGNYNFAGKKLDCVLFPNPGKGNFTLDYTGDAAEQLSISVMNLNGGVVCNRQWTVGSGFNRSPIDLSAVSKGIYIVDITGKSGSVSIKTVVE